MTNNKTHFMLFGAIFSILIAVTYATYIANYDEHYQEAKDYLSSETHTASDVISNKIKQLSNDVNLISGSPLLSRFIDELQNGEDASDSISAQQIVEIFKHYVAAHEFVYQLRFISVGNAGQEVIRVELDGDNTVSIPDYGLQKKSSRNYFKEIVRNDSNDIYISPINLNVENGVLETPYRPTIRFAVKVYDKDNDLFGFIIINYSIYKLFESIESNLKGDSRLFILNEDGFFLYHNDFDSTYGFDLAKKTTWDNLVNVYENHYSFKESPNKKFITETNNIKFNQERSIKLILVKDLKEIEIISLRNAYLNASAFLAIFLVFIVYYFYHRRSNKQLVQILIERSRLSSIVTFSQETIVGIDMQGLITDWNPSATKMYGYSESEAIGQLYETLLVTDKELYINVFNTPFEEHEYIPVYETTHKIKSGGYVEVSVTLSPIYAEHDELIGFSLIIRDISEYKKNINEISLLNSELETQVLEQSIELSSIYRLNKAIIDNAGSAIIAAGLDGIITIFNPAAEKLLGYSAKDVVGKITPGIFHLPNEVKSHTDMLCQKYNTVFEPGFKTFVFESDLKLKNEHEWTYVTKEGQHIPVFLSVSALFDESGNVSGYLGVATDITEITQSRKKLENVRDQLRQATEVANLGIWSWNRTLNQYRWNEHMYDIYDVEHGRYVSFEQWISWVDEVDRTSIHENIKAVLNGDLSKELTYRIHTPAGNTKVIQSSSALQRDTEDNLYVIGINRDITDQVNYESALKQAKIDSDNANRIKSEFVANMSHEIRTPMNAIIGLLQLIQQTELTSQQIEYINKSESAAKALLQIINDILDFSKIEAGKLSVEAKTFDLTELLDNVKNIMQAVLADKNIELTFNICNSVPRYMSMDSLRLQQILINLIGNAIKFTNQGYVRVNISQFSENKSHFLRCEVVDTGLGIEDSKQKMIFDAFEQAETSIIRSYGGTGLGLAISKHLVEMMDGHIEMSSTLNQGSTFTVDLPFTIEESFNIAGSMHSDSAALVLDNEPLKNIRVLLVEDNATNQLVASKLLSLKGASVTIANNGQEALDIISSTSADFDAILMDIQMPIMDGYTASSILKNQLSIATPIIAMTANALDSDKVKAKEAGMQDHISKPFNVNDLVSIIMKHLK